MDFQFDVNANGRRLKSQTMVEEYSRLCLQILAGWRCKAKDEVAVLRGLISLYPAQANHLAAHAGCAS
jgi:putative transposase